MGNRSIRFLVQDKKGLRLFSQLGKAILLGIGTALFSSASVHAAESVLLQYQDRQRTVTTSNLETFAETGEAVSVDIQEFFAENPEIAEIAQEIITTEIYINPNFIERFESSSLGEFVLIQLNRVLGSPSGQEDLEPIRTAVVNSYEDNNRFSVLEIVQNYPADQIRLDFTGLEPVVNDVKAFIEKVEPALAVAREFLQDVVCDCEPTAEAAATEDVDTDSAEDVDTDGAEDGDEEMTEPQSSLPDATLEGESALASDVKATTCVSQ